MQELLRILEGKLRKALQTDVQYLVRGGFWISFGQGATIALSFLSAVAFANLLPKETYGTYKYILSIIAFLSIPTLGAMSVAIIQSAARNIPGSYLAGLREKLRWGSLTALGSLIAGSYYVFQGNWEIGGALLAVSILVPIFEAFSLWGAFLAGKKHFRESTSWNAGIQAISTMITISLLFFTDHPGVLVFSYFFVNTTLRFFAHTILSRRHADMRTKGTGGDTAIFGRRLSFAGIPGTVSGILDNLLLWHFLGPVALATYAFAQSTTAPARSMMKAMFDLALPKFSEKYGTEFISSVHRKVAIAFALFVPFTVLYVFAIPFIYRIFFPQYLETIPYAQILGLIFLFFPFKLYSATVQTRTDRRAIYALNIVIPIVSSIVLIVLVPLFGVWGAVSGILVNYAISSAFSLFYFFRIKE